MPSFAITIRGTDFRQHKAQLLVLLEHSWELIPSAVTPDLFTDYMTANNIAHTDTPRPSNSVIHGVRSPSRLVLVNVLYTNARAALDLSGDWLRAAPRTDPDTFEGLFTSVVEQAEMVTLWVGPTSGRLGVRLIMPDSTIIIGLGIGKVKVNENGAVRVVQMTGQIVASRDNILVAEHTDKTLQWIVAYNGYQAVIMPDGTTKSASERFVGGSLMPIATKNASDRTSYYFHPKKRKIYKLNNIVEASGVRDSVLSLQETLNVARVFRSWNSTVGVELVMTGGRVPLNASSVPEAHRRRIMRYTDGKVTFDTGRLVSCHDGEFCVHHPYEPDFSTTGSYSVEGFQGDIITAHNTINPDIVGDTHFMGDGRICEIVAQTAHRNELVPALWPGYSRVTVARVEGRFIVGVALAPLPARNVSCALTLDQKRTVLVDDSGDLSVIRIFTSANWSRILADQWVSYLYDPSGTDAVRFGGQRREDLINLFVSEGQEEAEEKAQVASEGVEVRHAWLSSWGPDPCVPVSHTRHHEILVRTPNWGPKHTCVACGTPVGSGRTEGAAHHRPGFGGFPHGDTLCMRCVHEGNGAGGFGGLGYFQCTDCSDWFAQPHGHTSPVAHVCAECFGDDYNECTICGNHFHTVELNADGVCRSCRVQGARLHEYNYRPRLVFHKLKNEPVFFGAEIEMEINEDMDAERIGDHASEVLSYPGCKNFMFAKRDGSLSRGAEFVTQPFSLEWYLQNTQRFQDIFQRMESKGFVAKRSCGLHIHVTRSPHTSLEEFRVLQLMYENPEAWMKLSTRVGDRFCKFKSEATPMCERVRVARTRTRFGDRYVAINPTDRDTLEWRIWAGTGQYVKFASALALTAGAHLFARSGAIGTKPKMAKFVNWLKSHEVLAPLVAERLPLLTF